MFVISIIEQYYLQLSNQPFIKKYSARAFSQQAKLKVLLVFQCHRICFCQIYPFMHYKDEFAERFGVELRLVNSEDVRKGVEFGCRDADIVLFQTWFNIAEVDLMRTLEYLRVHNPRAKLHFVDSFAPADLRLSAMLDDFIDGYITKSLMADRSCYNRAMIGGSRMIDYYHKLYDIEGCPEDWSVKESFLQKLRLSPTFATAPKFLSVFEDGELPTLEGRSIDLHARMAVQGTPWYAAMREHAERSSKNISGINTVSGFGVSSKQFMAEMANSKACFSPFGYGEICWRDIEAMLCGAVLIKPDMGHLEMDPVMHIANETYVPVKWDFSDLEEKVRQLINDDNRRKTIAKNAFNLLRDYARNKTFVDQFAYLFEPEKAPAKVTAPRPEALELD